MKDNILVSVIIPTYNREKLISRCIDSILNQTYSNIEIIIVDDCSTDNTEQVVKNYNNEKIKYYKLEENRRACYARNYGIEHSKGEYIAFLDSDDAWHSNKIEKQLNYLIEKDVDMVFCGMNRFEVGNDQSYYYPLNRNINSNDIYLQVLKENCIATVTIFMKRQVYDKVHFNVELKRYQDWDFALNICKLYKVDYIPEALVDSWIQLDSISNTTNEFESLYTFFQEHISEIKENKEICAFYYSRLARRARIFDMKYATRLYRMSLKEQWSFNVFFKYLLCGSRLMYCIDKFVLKNKN